MNPCPYGGLGVPSIPTPVLSDQEDIVAHSG
jgi:hypothetical protein